MSMSYNECRRLVGLDHSQRMPEIEYRWVGYTGGKIFECKNMTEASQYTLNDRLATPESVKRREDFLNSNIEKEKLATEMFQKSLRADYIYLPEKLYQFCYAVAYKRKQSEGLDEVAEYLGDVIAFAQKVTAITSED